MKPVRILLVEDEEMVQKLVCATLQRLGYKVLLRSNGPAAIKLWDEIEGKVDLLLTDMNMPEGLTGLQVAEHCLKQRPELPVVVMSGYSAELISPEFEQGRSHYFLPKPFLTEKLTNTVATCLRNCSAPATLGSIADYATSRACA